MTNLDTLLPVTLPSRPCCEGCLSWSSEDLAVAGSENVHILTAKGPTSRAGTAGHPQWSIYSIRANHFRHDEWPEQFLDTIRDFSIGEEQSNSLVTAVAWSSAGLGLHRRSILGVLTSNLILGLWESNGTHTDYKRTCIVNKFINLRNPRIGGLHDRRALRIRSFAWSPPLMSSALSRWGLSYLVVADDYGNISFLFVGKENSARFGDWKIEVRLRIALDELNSIKSTVSIMSPLQRRLYEQTPVTKIGIGAWQDIKNPQAINTVNGDGKVASRAKFISKLTVKRGAAEHTGHVHASVAEDGQVTLKFYNSSEPNGDGNSQAERLIVPADSSTMTDEIAHPETYFKEAISQLLDDFDTTFRLAGHVRTRYWGSCVSPDRAQAVTCVTLHPSDMVEYTIPSAEKCTLIFRKTDYTDEDASAPNTSIHETILQFAAETLQRNDQLRTYLDWKLVRVYSGLAKTMLEPGSGLRNSLEEMERDLQGQGAAELSVEAQVGSQSHTRSSLNEPEECDICGASIPFTKDTTGAICRHGHQFSRCQLSFLTIQEPGISKSCSQCGKQFLDLTKLDPNSCPSFTQTVFDYFDSCPYCQAKFRG